MKQCCASGASHPMPSIDDIDQLTRNVERVIQEGFIRAMPLTTDVTVQLTKSELEQAAAEYRQASAVDRAIQQVDRALEQAGRAIFDARRELEKANGGSPIFGSYSEVSARAHQRLVEAAIGAGK